MAMGEAIGTAAALASKMGITPRELPVKTLQKALTDKGIEVYVAECTVRTQVVNTADMVVMGVGDKHSVDASELLVHELLPYVGTTVYEQPGTGRLNHGGSTQPAVVRVAALADLARTPERGHSARRSCTKEI